MYNQKELSKYRQVRYVLSMLKKLMLQQATNESANFAVSSLFFLQLICPSIVMPFDAGLIHDPLPALLHKTIMTGCQEVQGIIMICYKLTQNA